MRLYLMFANAVCIISDKTEMAKEKDYLIHLIWLCFTGKCWSKALFTSRYGKPTAKVTLAGGSEMSPGLQAKFDR